MYIDIAYEEYERLEESVKDGTIEKNDTYLDILDFEYDYSHNHIEENQRELIRLANNYLRENKIRFVASCGCEKVWIKKLPENEDWTDYQV